MSLVLVVDDSLYARRVHGRIISAEGHEVLEAATGEEAIETFVQRRPDLVLLDLTIGDMGGLEVLQKLREVDPSARVLVVSADVQRSTEKMVLEAGALAFLRKPVDAELLLTEMRKVTGE